MNNFWSFTVVILTFYFIISCNNSETSKQDELSPEKSLGITREDTIIATDFCSEEGSRNFLIDPIVAAKMINHFNGIYLKNSTGPLPGFEKSYWVNSCIVFELENFFNNSAQYDGLRIIFGATTTDNKKTKLFLVPTIPTINSTTDPTLNGHEDKWDLSISDSGCAASDLFLNHIAARPQVEIFHSFYREKFNAVTLAKRDSLSEKIWVDECVIKSLASILRKHSGILDGISIQMAAYDKTGPKPPKGQNYPNQSTIIIVTTKPGIQEGTHDPVWEITKKYIDIIIRTKDINTYNHGELCPNSCN